MSETVLMDEPRERTKIELRPPTEELLSWGRASEMTIYGNPPVEFDGHKFDPCVSPVLLTGLDLAYRARRGDDGAKLLLETFKVSVFDSEGKRYWPAE